jgi:hypothetical protein
MPISDAFAQIEHQPNIYDVVHVKYFDEVRELRCTSCWMLGLPKFSLLMIGVVGSGASQVGLCH